MISVRVRTLLSAVVLYCAACITVTVSAAEWYVAPDGKADAAGTKAAPWDIESALGGAHKVAPGDTVWVGEGNYKYPFVEPAPATEPRGWKIKLAGTEQAPIVIRGEKGKRVTLDGGLETQAPASYLWIRDLELIVSEPRPAAPVDFEKEGYQGIHRPWGGLNVSVGTGCKYINLVIHDNSQGVSFFTPNTDSELYGCLIYDNGWEGTQRGHGHGTYTQNQTGTKTISDNIYTKGFGYAMHAYGSSGAYIDNYLFEGNIVYNAGKFLVGGGRPSNNIKVLDNYFYNINMQIGYLGISDGLEYRGNIVLGGRLGFGQWTNKVEEDNISIVGTEERPTAPTVIGRPNKYDSDRANLVIFNWQKNPTVPVDFEGFLKPGDKYQLLDPTNFYGEPVHTGTYDGKPIELEMPEEFAAFVVRRQQ